MAYLNDSHGCCGLDEVHGLEPDPVENLKDICRAKYEDGEVQAFILITDNVAYRNGERLVNYIRRNKLGKVISTEERLNPTDGHTRNKIRAWLWSPNEDNLKKWWGKHDEDDDDDDDDDYYGSFNPFN